MRNDELTVAIDFGSLVRPVTFRGIYYSMLRLDRMPAWASGNKYFKLKPFIQQALDSRATHVVSKGGMFSNHLDAMAKACHHFGLKAACIIRTHQPDPGNPTILRLQAYGATTHFLQPWEYDAYDTDAANQEYPGCLFIPEGGLGPQGISGAIELGRIIRSFDFRHIMVMGGTMCTAAGIIRGCAAQQFIHCIPAWKGCNQAYLQHVLDQFNIAAPGNWDVWPDYHVGGFGKWDFRLRDFMIEFTRDTGIPLDPVYTGKMVFAFHDRVNASDEIDPARSLLVHTGGLQGIEGYAYRFPEAWKAYKALCE